VAATFETLRARAALAGLALLRSDGANPIYCLGAFGDSVPTWAHSIESVEAALQSIENRQRDAVLMN
jgi:hypothetical protein